jgi:hypothetical protein
MKKVFTYLISFVLVFMATYLILCYLPSLRIKLFAPSMEYFVESIKHMVFFKTMVSVVVGLLAVGIPFIIQRRTK